MEEYNPALAYINDTVEMGNRFQTVFPLILEQTQVEVDKKEVPLSSIVNAIYFDTRYLTLDPSSNPNMLPTVLMVAMRPEGYNNAVEEAYNQAVENAVKIIQDEINNGSLELALRSDKKPVIAFNEMSPRYWGRIKLDEDIQVSFSGDTHYMHGFQLDHREYGFII